MSVSLIQSFINNDVSSNSYIRPVSAKGKLVKSGILDAPVLLAEDIRYGAHAVKHAWKGTANDHELGKINNLGMFAGGLGIASYLFTQRPTMKTRGMEFVGLASFFASMVIWPQIAIRLPARLIHGVDVQQKYEDSFGRKKSFFHDPQYIPWDLYSDEDINKIGDRMRVPKDIPERREAIQEKMKKIAIQNNTLWMLTAGFATPITAALICNRLEKPLENYVKNRQNKRLDTNFENFETLAADCNDTVRLDAVKELISKNKDKPIDEKLYREIRDALTYKSDAETARCIKNDLVRALWPDFNKYRGTIPDFESLNQYKSLALDSKNQAKIEGFAKLINDFENELKGIIEFKAGKTGEGDSVIAKFWTDLQADLLKIFEFSPKDIEQARYHESFMLEKLMQKFEMGDEKKYNKAMSKLADMYLNIQNVFGDDDKYKNTLRKLFKDWSEKFEQGGLTKFSEHVKGSMQHNYEADPKERVQDLKNTIHRLWNALDFFKRVGGVNENDMVAYAKKLYLSADAGEYECKFKDCDLTETYKTLMKIMYADPYHKDTAAILEKKGLLETAEAYRKNIIKLIGNHEYWEKPYHVFDRALEYGAEVTPQERARLIGSSIVEQMFKSGKSQYNTNKWLKIIGISGSVLLGVTVGAQFLFGRGANGGK